jgi:Ran GTPase-activating protein (RanGAP) involved in mRNA processing and transport
MIGTEGFMKLAKRLKNNTSLVSVNVSSNSMSHGDFTNLEKFLVNQRSLITLNMSNCGLPKQAYIFLGEGLAKN